MSKPLNCLWIFLALVIFVYSYGFVDLNLTLSSQPIVFNFVTTLQRLVYFNRPTSLLVFGSLITVSFLLYGVTLRFMGKIKQFPWVPVSLVALILAVSYPMLSHDVFKYLFSAKVIALYHQNPYLVTPDSFVGDPWLRFMRWVHTTTPYGPVFTGLTVPYYFLGLGKFVPMLYLFKLDQVAWYLLSVWLIGKIGRTRAQLYFALNPLILMEWLVNSHNDAPMITLLLLSLYLYLRQRHGWSFISLALSAGIKYVTAIFLPVILFGQQLKLSLNAILLYLLGALTLAPLLYHYSWQYQPWYVTWLVPFAALLPFRAVRITVAVYTFSVFSRYLSFVSTGSWLGTPLEHALMTFLPPVLTSLFFLLPKPGKSSAA